MSIAGGDDISDNMVDGDEMMKPVGDGDDDVFAESRYGWFGWTPGWLQKINKPRWLLLCLCINTLLQVKIKCL